jgi:hypothetical protein
MDIVQQLLFPNNTFLIRYFCRIHTINRQKKEKRKKECWNRGAAIITFNLSSRTIV